ncbi:hypothetical protein C8R45DRAFT_930769 [Mycena sanguinolenta]|nr:hypothetical protein C8R45DRAFT_930769 [Mycena sanguinolenta]
MHWHAGVIPKEFFHPPCYPVTLISESEDESESEPDALLFDAETVATPIDEERPWPVPGKKSRVCEWVQKDAKRPRMDATLSTPTPFIPQKDRKKKFYNTGRSSVARRVEAGEG